MGYARTTPAVLYGPQSLGGGGLRSFYDCQRMSGTSKPVLEVPSIPLPHLETTFFPSLRTYITSTASALIVERSHVTPLQRIGDFHLMDHILQCDEFTPRHIRFFNYCRLFLQVHTIADLSTAQGTQMDLSLLQGHPSLLSST
jgi:hypothetical protein